MTPVQAEKTALWLFLYTLAMFAAILAVGLSSHGYAAQEMYETYGDVVEYRVRLNEVDNDLRKVLFFDLLFMIGYGGAIALTARSHVARNPLMAWVAGLGILLVVGLDVVENLTMLMSLELAVHGEPISSGRIAWQAGLSGAKWFTSAIVVVALTFVLPRDTLLEKLLIWSARIMLPLGTGLFVTDAFHMREAGGLLIFAGMGGGFALLALTIWLRLRQKSD